MEIEATVIVKKILELDGPKDAEQAIKIIRDFLENSSVKISTFQKHEAPTFRSSGGPCEELIHIVDMRPVTVEKES